MSFTLEKFIALRPYLFHLTAASNLESILSTRRLYPAAHFLRAAHPALLGSRRTSHLTLGSSHGSVTIRDQQPLQQGHIEWEAGWDMARFVEHLNHHVFFWPGNNDYPIPYGRKYLMRYRAEKPLLLKILTADLIYPEAAVSPLVCQWNSGAPRVSNGKYRARGGRTFVPASEAEFTPGKVAEVVFKGAVGLPYTFEYLDFRDEIWRVDYASCVIEYPEG